MSTAEELPTSIIPYESSFQFGGVILCLLMVLVGFFVQIIIITATLKGKNITTGTKFLLCVCFADLMFCTIQSVFSIWNLSLGGWASGPTGCIIEGFITIVAEGISLLSLTAVTLDRYLIVIVRKPISLKMCTFMILCIWVAFPILCCYVFYFGVAGKVVGLGKSNFTCVVAWWVKNPWALFAISLTLLILIMVLAFVVYCYSTIILFYRETRKKARPGTGESIQKEKFETSKSTRFSFSPIKKERSSVKPSSKVSQEEYNLLFRSLSITGTYFICWSPYTLRILYEIIQNVPCPDYIEVICDCFVGLYPLLTAYFMIRFDKRAQSSVYGMFGFAGKPTVVVLQKRKTSVDASKKRTDIDDL